MKTSSSACGEAKNGRGRSANFAVDQFPGRENDRAAAISQGAARRMRRGGASRSARVAMTSTARTLPSAAMRRASRVGALEIVDVGQKAVMAAAASQAGGSEYADGSSVDQDGNDGACRGDRSLDPPPLRADDGMTPRSS